MLIGSSASSAALALLVVRRHLPINTRTQFFRSFIYNRSSTNPANLAKIGRVDVEIIRLTSTAPLYISVSITLMFFFLVPFQNIFFNFPGKHAQFGVQLACHSHTWASWQTNPWSIYTRFFLVIPSSRFPIPTRDSFPRPFPFLLLGHVYL